MTSNILINTLRKGTKDEQIAYEVLSQDCYNFLSWKPRRYPKFIVDIGAQIGCFSCLASQTYGEAQTLSFEMLKDNYKIAKKNLSQYENNKCFHGAVMGKNKPIGFFENKENSGGHKVVYKGKDSYLGENRINLNYKLKSDFNSFNFTEIFSDNNIDKIDFLKMDCEGSEYEIIPHLIETDLIKKIDNISIELHGRDQKEYAATLNFLSESYESVTMKGNHLAHFRNLCI